MKLYYGWPLVAALGVTTIVSYGTTQYLFGVLVVPISQELGWSRAAISGAFSLGVLVSGLLGLPVGRLVDRHGARLLMAGGSLLGGLTLLALAAVQQSWQFTLLWAGGLGRRWPSPSTRSPSRWWRTGSGADAGPPWRC